MESTVRLLELAMARAVVRAALGTLAVYRRLTE
jgi:hypothetical protein